MESSQVQTRTREKEQPQKETRNRESVSRSPEQRAMEYAMQALRAGMSPRDLPPEAAEILASTLGNQTMLSLFGGGVGFALQPAPSRKESGDALPVYATEIRWPALTEPPVAEKFGNGRDTAFPVERLRPMGRGQVTDDQ